MSNLSISFILTTRNKLPALRHSVPRLLSEIRPDEEVVVVDGASRDGSAEYLADLHRAGRIHQFLSEPDKGESHALNKALLRARGDLIKFITDDDVFHWPTVRECQRFLVEQPAIAGVFTDGADTDWRLPDPFLCGDVSPRFEQWMSTRKPILLSCLGLVLRRACLPLTGLFHTGIIPVDHEFSLRLTSAPLELALYTGYGYVRVLNPRSNTVAYQQQVHSQVERIRSFYQASSEISLGRRLLVEAKTAMRPLTAGPVEWLRERFDHPRRREVAAACHVPHEWAETFRRCEAWLEEKNRRVHGSFLSRAATYTSPELPPPSTA